jgi:hypothetical protein
MFTIRGYFTHPDNQRRLESVTRKATMKTYKYKTIPVTLRTSLEVSTSRLLNNYGADGWRFVQCIQVDTSGANWIIVFEKEIEPDLDQEKGS